MSSDVIKKDLLQHYKLMADFFKHLSVLSLTFTIVGVGLMSDFFDKSTTLIPLHIAIPMLILSSFFSVAGHLSYVEVFRVPHLLSGTGYKKLMSRTWPPLMLFVIGVILIAAYVVLGIFGI